MNKEYVLKDGAWLNGPETLDLRDKTEILDKLEYDVWSLFCNMTDELGYTVSDVEPDWATVKDITDTMLKQLSDAGVKINA